VHAPSHLFATTTCHTHHALHPYALCGCISSRLIAELAQAGNAAVKVMLAEDEADAWQLCMELDDMRLELADDPEAAKFVSVLQVGSCMCTPHSSKRHHPGSHVSFTSMCGAVQPPHAPHGRCAFRRHTICAPVSRVGLLLPAAVRPPSLPLGPCCAPHAALCPSDHAVPLHAMLCTTRHAVPLRPRCGPACHAVHHTPRCAPHAMLFPSGHAAPRRPTLCTTRHAVLLHAMLCTTRHAVPLHAMLCTTRHAVPLHAMLCPSGHAVPPQAMLCHTASPAAATLEPQYLSALNRICTATQVRMPCCRWPARPGPTHTLCSGLYSKAADEGWHLCGFVQMRGRSHSGDVLQRSAGCLTPWLRPMPCVVGCMLVYLTPVSTLLPVWCVCN
jgi:hypothetical protein